MVIFLSNGPGDPEPLVEAIDVAKEIMKRDYHYLVFV